MTILDRHVPSALSAWAGFLGMCLGMFMAILDIQIVASSLPEIQAAPYYPQST